MKIALFGFPEDGAGVQIYLKQAIVERGDELVEKDAACVLVALYPDVAIQLDEAAALGADTECLMVLSFTELSLPKFAQIIKLPSVIDVLDMPCNLVEAHKLLVRINHRPSVGASTHLTI